MRMPTRMIRATIFTTTALRFGHALAVSKHGSAMPALSTRADFMKEHLPLAQKAMQYLDASPDPFHAVQTSIERLSSVGFEELRENEAFLGRLQPGGKYYYSRNKSTLVAFTVGKKYRPGNGFKVIGGHTDSPNLRVKPHSKRSAAGCIQIGVECYGGGLCTLMKYLCRFVVHCGSINIPSRFIVS